MYPNLMRYFPVGNAGLYKKRKHRRNQAVNDHRKKRPFQNKPLFVHNTQNRADCHDVIDANHIAHCSAYIL